MLLNLILRKCTGGYKFNKSQEKINHLIYICGNSSAAHALRKRTILPDIVFGGSLQLEMYDSETGPRGKKKLFFSLKFHGY